MHRKTFLAIVVFSIFAAVAQSAVVQIKHKGQVRAIFWTNDGKTLVTGGSDGVVKFSEVKTGKETRTFSLGGSVYAVAVSNDGKWLGVRQDGGSPPASVIDVKTGARRRSLSDVYARYYTPNLAFTSDGAVLVGAGPRGRMVMQHLRGGASASGSSQKIPGYFSAVAPNGAYAAWGTPTGTVQLYGTVIRNYSSLRVGAAKAMAFSPDAKTLAVAQSDGAIALWDMAAKQVVKKMTGMRNPATMLTYSGDGKVLGAYDPKDRSLSVWDIASGRLRRRVPVRQTGVHSMLLSRDGRLLVTAAVDRAVVWNVARPDLGKLQPIELTAKDLSQLWIDLANADFAKTDEAFRKLAAGKQASIPFIKSQIRKIAVPKVDDERIHKLLSDLNSDNFRIREKAQVELAKYGELAMVPLQKVLEKKTSLEVRVRATKLLKGLKEVDLTPSRQRVLEALELLEALATPAARDVLSEIARDALIPSIRNEAQTALQRLKSDAPPQ